jgi:hypothetical protein
MNARNYTDEWLKMCEENGEKDVLEASKNKIELFKTSPDVIRQSSQQYFKLYKSLIYEDPVSALYIKSALELPNGNEKPEIAECRITEHLGNTWRFEIYGIDPDADIINCQAEISGIEKFQYLNDIPWKGQLYFEPEEKKFQGRGYLEVQEENKPFRLYFDHISGRHEAAKKELETLKGIKVQLKTEFDFLDEVMMQSITEFQVPEIFSSKLGLASRFFGP